MAVFLSTTVVSSGEGGALSLEAHEIAGAIEHAQLHHQAKKKSQQIEALARMSQSIAYTRSASIVFPPAHRQVSKARRVSGAT